MDINSTPNLETREGRNNLRIRVLGKIERIKIERKALTDEWEIALSMLALLESLDADYRAADQATTH